MNYFKDQQGNIYAGDKANHQDVKLSQQEIDVYNFNKLKESKYIEIQRAFDNAMYSGHFVSAAIGIEIDCRRSSNKNDLQNVEGLIALEANNIDYVGLAEIKSGVTLEQLKAMRIEMIQYAFALYRKKWMLESQLPALTTIEEIEALKW